MSRAVVEHYIVNRATSVSVPFRRVDGQCLAGLVELGNLIHSHVHVESDIDSVGWIRHLSHE
jgi:hypothetical protein